MFLESSTKGKKVETMSSRTASPLSRVSRGGSDSRLSPKLLTTGGVATRQLPNKLASRIELSFRALAKISEDPCDQPVQLTHYQ
jgi:hypothetical protein